jgi:S1-C subfamily serine protease
MNYFKTIAKNIFNPRTNVLRVWTYTLASLLSMSLIVGGYFVYHIKSNLSEITSVIEVQESKISEAELTLAFLTEGNELLEAQLAEERSKRGEVELSSAQTREDFQQRIAALQTDVAKERETAKASDITTIVNNWSSRVARINCTFPENNGQTVTIRGSGTMTLLNGEPYLLTNKHVVVNEGSYPNTCTAYFPDLDKTVDLDRIVASGSVDKAHIKIADSSTLPASLKNTLVACSAKPNIGDKVVILGYPAVGSASSITATEGIISGFDEGYYITSAKIEQGNSGGAAILAKQNCFAGIPTLVVRGRLEALARILPI